MKQLTDEQKAAIKARYYLGLTLGAFHWCAAVSNKNLYKICVNMHAGLKSPERHGSRGAQKARASTPAQDGQSRPVVELVKTKTGFDLYVNLVYYPPKLNVIMDEFSLRSFEPEMQLCSPPEVDRIWFLVSYNKIPRAMNLRVPGSVFFSESQQGFYFSLNITRVLYRSNGQKCHTFF